MNVYARDLGWYVQALTTSLGQDLAEQDPFFQCITLHLPPSLPQPCPHVREPGRYRANGDSTCVAGRHRIDHFGETPRFSPLREHAGQPDVWRLSLARTQGREMSAWVDEEEAYGVGGVWRRDVDDGR